MTRVDFAAMVATGRALCCDFAAKGGGSEGKKANESSPVSTNLCKRWWEKNLGACNVLSRCLLEHWDRARVGMHAVRISCTVSDDYREP